jgi:hypothetical protein
MLSGQKISNTRKARKLKLSYITTTFQIKQPNNSDTSLTDASDENNTENRKLLWSFLKKNADS